MRLRGALVNAALILAILPSCIPLPAAMVRLPGTIQLLDSGTARPIEGAVVVRTWSKCDAAFPAGGDCSAFSFREGRSDSTGRVWFAPIIKPYLNLIVLPVVWWNWTEESAVLVFKPGYKTIIDKPGASSFKLERLPDSYWCRSEEADRARDFGYVDVEHATHILKDALQKEREEIKLLPKDVPGVFYHAGIPPPPQGGSLRIFDAALDAKGRFIVAANGPPSISILTTSGAWAGIKFPFLSDIDSVVSDEAGQIFVLGGGKVLPFVPEVYRYPDAPAGATFVLDGKLNQEAGRFLVRGREIFLIEKLRGIERRPGRSVPVLYHYDYNGKLICQSRAVRDFVFRDITMADDGSSILVLGSSYPAVNISEHESRIIRYDLACEAVSSCSLPNDTLSYPATSIVSLPQGGFVAATENRFSVFDNECVLLYEENLVDRGLGKVDIWRLNVDTAGERLYLLDGHYSRLLAYDLKGRRFPPK